MSDNHAGRDRESAFGLALIAEARRRLYDESLPRLRRCLDLLDDDEIWLRPNDATPSVGNLVVHLCGNARQWIVSGLGGKPDARNRREEFEVRGPVPRSALLSLVETTMDEVEKALDAVDPASLLAVRPVQAFSESGLSILVHVVEHFSYHVGQITYFVKSRKAVDLAYYGGIDLDRVSGPAGGNPR